MSIDATIERYIVDELLFADKDRKIEPDEDLIGSRLLDSVAIMQLILFIEKQFGVSIGDDEVLPENFRTIDRMKEFVESKQQVSRSFD